MLARGGLVVQEDNAHAVHHAVSHAVHHLTHHAMHHAMHTAVRTAVHTAVHTAPRLVVEDDLNLRIRRRSWLDLFEVLPPGLGKLDSHCRCCPRCGPRPRCRFRRSFHVGYRLHGIFIEDLELGLLVGK